MRNFSPRRSEARAYRRGMMAALKTPQDAPQPKSAVTTPTTTEKPHGEAHTNAAGVNHNVSTPNKST